MGGIVGVVNLQSQLRNETNIKKMMQAIAHRGEKHMGIFSKDGVALGCRTMDSNESVNTPFPFTNGNLTIIMDGMIKNYSQIRGELEGKGRRFKTNTYAELIVYAYEEWKEECLQYLDGMWAFVIYDEIDQTLFCSRDRFGIKPFYYFHSEGELLFASEIKGILSTGYCAKANIDILLTYLIIGLENYDENTFFDGIYQLLPGHYAVFNILNDHLDIYRYYDLEEHINVEVSFEESIQHLRSSISYNTRHIDRIGALLSGGIDSSIITSTLAELMGSKQNLVAITAQSELSNNDESMYAKEVIDHWGIEWCKVKPSYKDFFEHIESCLKVQEEPVGSPSVFMQYWVMKKANELGLKVVIDGQGGDEIFLGYERYYAFYFKELFYKFKWILLIKEFILASKNSKLNIKSLAGYTIYFNIPFIRKYRLNKRNSFLKKEYMSRALKIFDQLNLGYTNLREIQINEITKFNLPHLLRYADRNSMAHSVEVRVPFIERNTVQAGVSLSLRNKIKNGFTKYILRKYAEDIMPKTIAWRKNKYGFEAPDLLWLQRHLPIMQDKISQSILLKEICEPIIKIENLPLSVLWKLYNVAVWEEQYLDH